MSRIIAGLLVVGSCLLASTPLQAHHSLAGVYEVRKQETVTGVLTKIAFTNPHGAMYLQVQAADGSIIDWTMTTGSANALANLGFGEGGANYVKPGDTVTISYFPARNGKPLGFIRTITLPNANTVEFEAL
ncbi:MAG: DUF6152 family protein [Pseudohongiellaceae bacterium]|jgi:hypothetical protein